MQPTPSQLSAAKGALFIACLLPLAYYAWGAWQDTLGANPVEAVTRGLGDWTLRLLLITLTVTPLRRFTGWHWLLRLRRMLGLFTFFYVCLHLTTYLWLDQFFDWQAIARDILKRPFITVGMSAFILLVPLAATSNNAMIHRLGGRRWQALHRAVYPIAILGVTHYWWMVKKDITEPVIYAVILALLLGLRLLWREQERRQLAGEYGQKPKGRVVPVTPRS
jgi:sulfoxide reductase heme-binding subunit YedZ